VSHYGEALARTESAMNDAKEPETFEQALVELERVVRDLEDGQTGLESALRRYEQGVALLKRCYGQLRQAEQRILELIDHDGQGNPRTRPFEPTPPTDTVKDKPNGA
jgi:exodeoxyribonuclease VII small subunit